MKFIRAIFVFLNILVVILLMMSYAAGFLSPEKFHLPTLMGFLFPYIAGLNVLFVIFWLIFKYQYSLISLIALLAGFGLISRFVQISGKNLPENEEKEIMYVISYNTQIFGWYHWDNNLEIRDSILDFIEKEQPDILCIQEYFTTRNSRFQTGKLIQEKLNGISIHEAFAIMPDNNQAFGLATFIRYPIIGKGNIQFENSNNLVQFTDFIFQNDTLRLYNAHLQSLHFNLNDYSEVDEINLREISIEQLGSKKQIIKKFLAASKQRAAQADSLASHIALSPYPVIVCGDFNDTPGSYAYHQIAKNLKDAFKASGQGFDFSYSRKILKLRIDHILYDKSLESYAFNTKNVNFSDHFPVSCYLSSK